MSFCSKSKAHREVRDVVVDLAASRVLADTRGSRQQHIRSEGIVLHIQVKSESNRTASCSR